MPKTLINCAAGILLILIPPIRISPVVGLIKPRINLIKVDLPAPVLPRITKGFSPSCITKEISSRMGFPFSYVKLTFLNSITKLLRMTSFELECSTSNEVYSINSPKSTKLRFIA